MHRELTVTALTPAATTATLTPAETTVTLLRNGESVSEQQRRIMVLEYENSCLKQAMSDLMMEKLILKVALEARYEPAQQDSVLALTHDAARNLSECARNAGVYVAPAIVGTQLRANYEELVNAPMPDSIAEFIRELEKGQRPGSTKQSLIGQFLGALIPTRSSRPGR
jgi:hypothetical protein